MSEAQQDSTIDRQFARFTLEGDVRLYSSSQMWQTEVLDLSLRGALLRKPADFSGKRGQSFRIEIRLAATTVISMAVELARSFEDSIGFKTGRMDFDSFSHLKRLIELNLGDSDSLKRELSQLKR